MKLTVLATFVAATIRFGSAQRHYHRVHQHLHRHHAEKKDIIPIANVKHEPVIVYELGGKTISESELREGLNNGTLYLGDSHIKQMPETVNEARYSAPVDTLGGENPVPPAASYALLPADVSAGERKPNLNLKKPSLRAEPSFEELSSSTSNSFLSFDGPVPGVNTPFPDGQIDCSDFPSQYGAVALPWLGLDGWAGVQLPGPPSGNGVSNIETVTSGLLQGRAPCAEGCYCSYACAYGYQKSQWPQMQGEAGESIGGLQCKNGKLHLTNPGLSNKLCIPGASPVPVSVKTLLDNVVSVCRTDYPGTENMVIPLSVTPGSTYTLTVPNSDEYYHWQTNGQSAKTSAQYYVNNMGIPVNEACLWGTDSQTLGNFSPLIIGAGYDNDAAYLSIFQNAPTTHSKLDFTVEIVGDDGGYDNLQGRCKYSNGNYCSGVNYDNCNQQGCTVAVPNGSAMYVFSK